jgi:hypothetical protein
MPIAYAITVMTSNQIPSVCLLLICLYYIRNVYVLYMRVFNKHYAGLFTREVSFEPMFRNILLKELIKESFQTIILLCCVCMNTGRVSLHEKNIR